MPHKSQLALPCLTRLSSGMGDAETIPRYDVLSPVPLPLRRTRRWKQYLRLILARTPRSGTKGDWRAKATVGREGWVVEIAIPFATLGVAPEDGLAAG